MDVEDSQQDPLGWTHLYLKRREPLDVSYHVMLLHEAGFIVGEDLSSDDGLEWLPKRLTYKKVLIERRRLYEQLIRHN